MFIEFIGDFGAIGSLVLLLFPIALGWPFVWVSCKRCGKLGYTFFWYCSGCRQKISKEDGEEERRAEREFCKAFDRFNEWFKRRNRY